MNYTLFDEPSIRQSLLPLTFTRPVSLIRVGILTIAEKWELFTKQKPLFLTEDYLHEKFPQGGTELCINGAIIPNVSLFEELKNLKQGEALVKQGLTVAYYGRAETRKECQSDFKAILYPWDIFAKTSAEIRNDAALLDTKDKKWYTIEDHHTKAYNTDNIFIEEGVKIRAAVLNAEDGPIYLGKHSEIQEGALIKGPFALGEYSVVNMGGKMRGDSSIGPYCKVGGEVSNSVLFGYSNKGHDGFIGNTIIGEWCNLGADTNTSNLKNNYGQVQVYSYKEKKLVNTGLQFCGLIMGDHSKAGINTMFNTGTIVGVCANIFGSGFPDKFIPSFAWGGAEGLEIFKLDKAYEVAERVMARRKLTLEETDKRILKHIFDSTSK